MSSSLLNGRRIAVTGASGLIGRALATTLCSEGASVVGLDIRADGEARGDVRDPARVRALLDGASGVIHLAAVSRVVWGEQDPELCWSTNVGGLQCVLDAAKNHAPSPWVIFASSREVYGQPDTLPVDEDCPAKPINVYGRSKVAGEKLVEEARGAGLRSATLRLSNVFGSVHDHADRVIPAFARAAIDGKPLRVDGLDHTFDFTHIDDVTEGFTALAAKLQGAEPLPPPIHLVSGRSVTLGDLAALAVRLAGSASRIETAPERDYDVAKFTGRPERARAILGWQARVTLEDGLASLIDTMRRAT